MIWRHNGTFKIRRVETQFFALSYLSDAEKKVSTNELEMLAVVWGADNLQNYLLGQKLHVIIDHKVLLSLLKEKKGKKDYLVGLQDG